MSEERKFKAMNQHIISSMLETLSSLRRKSSESAAAGATGEKTTTSLLVTSDGDQKDVSDVESMSSKTKSLFKDLISDNGATNTILQNCSNFIKCTSTISSHLNASSPSTSSPATALNSNGSCKQQKVNNHDDGDDNNNEKQAPKVMTNLHPTRNETMTSNDVNENSTKKRNSIAPNGDSLSPSPHTARRKSSYDARMLRSNGNGESGVIMKPLKTKNIITQNETFDTLHYRAIDVSRLF